MSVRKNSAIILQGVFDHALFDRLRKRRVKQVFVMEGRPKLEAAKSSCRELLKRGIKPVLIADNMAGFLFYKKLAKEVWVSYKAKDNGGILCYTGGMILGVLGRRHKVPVNAYPAGGQTAFLGRPQDITQFNGEQVAPGGVSAYVPLVEWVPEKYIGKIYG